MKRNLNCILSWLEMRNEKFEHWYLLGRPGSLEDADPLQCTSK